MPDTITTADARALRKALGLSQVKFAALLGVDPSTVSTWERGLAEPQQLARERIRAVRDATLAKAEHMAGHLPA